MHIGNRTAHILSALLLGLLTVALTVGLSLLAGLAVPTVRAQSNAAVDVLTQGGQIYADNCAVCHGADGQGRVGATLAKDWPSIRPELTVRNVIVNGIPGSVMPAWSQANGGPLTDEDIDALVAYILFWQTGDVYELESRPTATPRPAIAAVPEVEGDPNNGAVLFDANCVVCHGVEGQGRVGATLAKDWPSIRPDLTVRNAIVRGIPGSVMPAWSQANGGPLTAGEIDDLTAYILSWEASSAAPETPEQSVALPGVSNGWYLVVGALVLLVLAGLYLGLQRK